jgi:transposase
MDGHKRYPSDLSDAEWALIEPHLPEPKQPGTRGRPPKTSRREVVNAIRYLARSGCAWRYLPTDFPPWETVYWYFARWDREGIVDRLCTVLREQLRVRQGRHPHPSAAAMDSQSVRAADTAPKATRGWDNGKKVNGRKRHIVVDTLGLLLIVLVTAANVSDSAAGRQLLWRMRGSHPRVRRVWVDGGYQNGLLTWAWTVVRTVVDKVSVPAGAHRFVVLPRRWVAERTLAWISKYRRCVRDYERTTEHSEALVKWAMIGVMTARLAHRPATARRDQLAA